MRRISIIITLVAILALLLAACNPAQPTPTEAPTSPAITEAPIEETEAGGAPTEPAVTEEPTEAGIEEPTGAATPEVTEAAGETEAVEETGTPEAGTGGTGGAEAEAAPRLTDIMDYSVRFANSSIRGQIVDTVLDLNAQQVQYLLVNVSSAAFGGDRVIPIPWTALALDRENQNFSLGFNLVTATDAPTVDLEAGIDFSNPDWDADIRAFWANQPAPGGAGTETGTPGAEETETTGTPEAGGATATPTSEGGAETSTPEAGGATATPGAGGAEATGTPGASAGTEEPGEAVEGTPRYILGSNVLNASIYFGSGAAPAPEGTPDATAAPAPVTLGEALGLVEDLIIDPNSGAIVTVLASVSETLGLEGDFWVPIPASLLAAGPRPGTLVLSISQDAIDLQSLPTIDPNALPDFSQPDWLEQFQNFWEGLTP